MFRRSHGSGTEQMLVCGLWRFWLMGLPPLLRHALGLGRSRTQLLHVTKAAAAHAAVPAGVACAGAVHWRFSEGCSNVRQDQKQQLPGYGKPALGFGCNMTVLLHLAL